MTDAPLLRVDERGRISIGKHVRRNGIEPSVLYALSFGPDQSLILRPATIIVPTTATETEPIRRLAE